MRRTIESVLAAVIAVAMFTFAMLMIAKAMFG